MSNVFPKRFLQVQTTRATASSSALRHTCNARPLGCRFAAAIGQQAASGNGGPELSCGK